MYYQKDYVLRMIEMLGDLVRRICSIARQADARAELDEIAQRACGLPMSILRTGDADMLSETMREPQRYLAAELLMIAEEVDSRTQTEEELLPLRTQALLLFASLHDPDHMLPAAAHAGRLVADSLGALPADVLLASAGLLERAGEYAAAEDALYAAHEKQPAAKPLLLAFYDRLDTLDDRALFAGRFSRAEIAEGRAALS